MLNYDKWGDKSSPKKSEKIFQKPIDKSKMM